MRKFLLIATILFSSICQGQTPLHKLIRKQASSVSLPDTVAKFALSGSGTTTSGWAHLSTNAWSTLLSATQNSVTVNTVGTGDTYWNDNGNLTSGGSGTETTACGPFPGSVGAGWQFNFSTTAPSGGNIEISGLNTGYTYQILVYGNRATVSDNREADFECIDNGGSDIETDVNMAASSSGTSGRKTRVNGAGSYVTFSSKVPDGAGKIFLSIYASTSWTYGYINGIIIIRTA